MPKASRIRTGRLRLPRKRLLRRGAVESAVDESPAAKLSRLGPNWNKPDLPIAALAGFPDDWTAFIFAYFPKSRALFVPQETGAARLRHELDHFENIAIYIWEAAGANADIMRYAEARKLPLISVKPGPLGCVRSGGGYTAPASLIFEPLQGGARMSNLERLLARHDFSVNKRLLEKACYLLALYKSLDIGQTNNLAYMPVDNILGPKIRKQILALGESCMDNEEEAYDQLSRLIDQASRENPGAKILYLPFSEWLSGTKDNFGAPDGVTRLDGNFNVADLAGRIDGVYAISPFAGFEALSRGLPVALRGLPFYANRGLTHDIHIDASRCRQLSREELFCAVFLLYPKYLADSGDSVTNCLAAMFRLHAERHENILKLFGNQFITNHFQEISKTEWWPVLFREGRFAERFKKGGSFSQFCDFRNVLGENSNELWRNAIIFSAVGQTINTSAFGGFLATLGQLIKPDFFLRILQEIWEDYPCEIILLRMAETCKKMKEYRLAERAYREGAAFIQEKRQEPAVIPQKWPYALALARLEKKSGRHEEAIKIYFRLLLSGMCAADVLCDLGEIAISRFDYDSACRFFSFAAILEPDYRKGWPWLQAAIASALTGDNPARGVMLLARACWLDPRHLGAEFFSVRHGNAFLDNLPVKEALLEIRPPHARNNLAMAEGYLRLMRPGEAEAALRAYSPAENEKSRYYRCLASAFHYQERTGEGIALLAEAKKIYPEKEIYQDLLRLCILKGDFEQARQYLHEAERLTIDINEIYRTRIYFGLEQPQKAYESYRASRTLPNLKIYLRDKYAQSMSELRGARSILIAAAFGPGDEIRFASFYRLARQKLAPARVCFTCDPRLNKLLTRSFPELEFIPTARRRSLPGAKNKFAYNELPNSRLHMVFDNAGWALAQKMDKVTIVMDLLGDLARDESDFDGHAYLRADETRVNYWRQRLGRIAGGRRVIGISWRSNLITSSRNENYFNVEQIAPVFKIPGVLFVNLQYDECSEELEWVNNNFPGALVNFTEIDQFNDLDETAALMKALDLVIAPATTVIELAGALGCRALLLSNSPELRWRKKNGGNADIWYNNVTHIEGNGPGHKESLISGMTVFIKNFMGIKGYIE